MHRADLSPVQPGHGQNAKNPLTAQVGAHFTPTAHIRPNTRNVPAPSTRNNDGVKNTAAPDLAAESTKTQPQRGFTPIRQAPRRFKNYLQI